MGWWNEKNVPWTDRGHTFIEGNIHNKSSHIKQNINIQLNKTGFSIRKRDHKKWKNRSEITQVTGASGIECIDEALKGK